VIHYSESLEKGMKLAEFDRNRRRKFGQNFLNNQGIIHAISKDLPWEKGDVILEIGPGHGALTENLLAGGAKVKAVEIDIECVELLKEKFQEMDFSIEHCDFLDFDLEAFCSEHPGAWLIGNLPYNMATPIITSILPYLQKMKGMMIMVQLEAATRLIAGPGTKDYGFLSVQLACYAKAKILRKVGPENFNPKPNVMSATLLIEALPESERLDPEMLDMVGTSFRKRRKVLTNSLESFVDKEIVLEALEKLNLSPIIRGEALNPTQFAQLYSEIKNSI
jgi:16S rRNA (adenine1518-N6/adenine1519-N6)-dimethyltransferase